MRLFDVEFNASLLSILRHEVRIERGIKFACGIVGDVEDLVGRLALQILGGDQSRGEKNGAYGEYVDPWDLQRRPSPRSPLTGVPQRQTLAQQMNIQSINIMDLMNECQLATFLWSSRDETP